MLKEQYEAIRQWQDKTFTQSTALSCVNHLIEEVLELRDDIEKGVAANDEVADVFLLMIGVCNKRGMSYEDITKAIDDKMQINFNRQWGKVNDQGYVKHIN